MRNEQLGSTTAVILLVLAVVDRRRSRPGSRGGWEAPHDRDRARRRVRRSGRSPLATVVFLMTPLVVTVAVSFGSSTVFTLPPPDWSLRWYERLAEHARPLARRCSTSVQVAALSTARRAGARHALRHRPGARPLSRAARRSRPSSSRR